jgi:hypothetical protein
VVADGDRLELRQGGREVVDDLACDDFRGRPSSRRTLQ